MRLTNAEIKERELKILLWIDKICKEFGIEYFLGAGTLIGAVRHKGFIPWDDDIDLFMKRADYEKFEKIVSSINNDQYMLLSLNQNKEYYHPFYKVVDKQTFVEFPELKKITELGVWVDIFPLDYYDSKAISFGKIKALEIKRTSSSFSMFKKSRKFLNTIPKWFLYQIYKNKNPNDYAKKIDSYVKSVTIPTNKLYIGSSPVGDKDVYESSWFDGCVYLDFEGHKFPAPVKYDEVLRHRYGNYMIMPPENQRIPHDCYAVIK